MPLPEPSLFPSSETYPGWPDAPLFIREYPDDSLALYVENPDGSETRFAGDEPDHPLTDYTLSSTLPGGFSTCDGDFLLTENATPPGKFSAVSAKLTDRTTVWEGRTESTPERSEERLLTLNAMGHQASLKDAAGIVFLGVNDDISTWEDPPLEYVETESGSNSINVAFSAEVSEGGATIRMDDRNRIPSTARGEIWFRAPAGESIAEVQWVGSDAQDVDMIPSVRTFDDLTAGSVDSQALTTGGYALDLSVQRWESSPVGQWVVFRDTPNTNLSSGSDAPAKAARTITLHAISVFGDHDLPRIEIDGLPDGLYFSDVIAYLIGLHTPLVTTVGGDSTIEQSSLALPHAAWLEATDLATILEDGIQYEPGKEWAVWENRAFYYASRNSMGLTWTVRRSEGARFIDTGETAAPDYNGVIVAYSDSDGVPRRAGPPGSGCDTEDSTLLDSDPDNPVNAFASILTQRYLVVDVGECKAEKAVELGQLALAEAIRRRFTGEVELGRYAECDGEILPTSLIRAGDRIVDGDSPTHEELPLVGASYSRSSERPFKGTVDTPANRLDSAIARMEARPMRINRKRIRRRLRRQHRKRQRSRD